VSESRVYARWLVAVILLWTGAWCAASPSIQRWHAEDVPVLFVAAPEIPMFKVRVVFAAGSARDGAAAGLASLTNALIGEGTSTLTTDEFHRRLENTGAQIGGGTTRDMAFLSLKSLSDHRIAQPAVALLNAALVEPRFDAADFARARQQMLAGLEQEKSSPAALGERAMHRAIYGKHPYALPRSGTEASVATLSLEAVRDFHRRLYVRKNALVVIVGALSRAEAETLATQVLAGLPMGERAPALPPVPPLTEERTERVEFPGAQSHLIFAQPGISRHDPDYFPLVVGNHVLGGNGSVALLFQEIREKRGLSYAVDSYFEPMAEAGPFVVSLQTDHRREREARTVLFDTLQRFIAEGPGETALEAAKQNLIGGFPLRIDSNTKLAEYLTIIGFYDLPLDYLEAYPRAVAAVTAAQVREAFQRRVRLAQMAKITVGPPAAQQ